MQKERVAIALGQFDGVHIGHKKVIDSCVSFARENGIKSVALTFYRNVSSFINGEDGKNASIFSLEERISALKNACIDEVLVLGKTRDFFDKSKEDFLKLLDGRYDISAFFSGEDFTFGKGGEGKAEDLISYAGKKLKKAFIIPLYKQNGEKISTSSIKELLKNGEMEKADSLLFDGYFVRGKVVKQRGVGKRIGFPTVNVFPDESKIEIKPAVYKGRVKYLGKEYKAIINYGERPTFNVAEKVVEAHLLDFNEDLYGETVDIYFDAFLREIQKFSSEEELKERLFADLESIK